MSSFFLIAICLSWSYQLHADPYIKIDYNKENNFLIIWLKEDESNTFKDHTIKPDQSIGLYKSKYMGNAFNKKKHFDWIQYTFKGAITTDKFTFLSAEGVSKDYRVKDLIQFIHQRRMTDAKHLENTVLEVYAPCGAEEGIQTVHGIHRNKVKVSFLDIGTEMNLHSDGAQVDIGTKRVIFRSRCYIELRVNDEWKQWRFQGLNPAFIHNYGEGNEEGFYFIFDDEELIAKGEMEDKCKDITQCRVEWNSDEFIKQFDDGNIKIKGINYVVDAKAEYRNKMDDILDEVEIIENKLLRLMALEQRIEQRH